MFYIRTADKLQRTAPWVESFEGGVDKLRKILIDDELGICADLEAEMDSLIGCVHSLSHQRSGSSTVALAVVLVA